MSIINLEFCKKKPHGYWILEHNTVMDAAKEKLHGIALGELVGSFSTLVIDLDAL